MILMHGTSSSNVKSIMIEGLRPRKDAGNWDKLTQIPSITNFVYLASEEINVSFHAMRTSLKNQNSTFSIVHTEVIEENLYPDENFYLSGLVDAAAMRKAQRKVIKNKQDWKPSLEKKKLVAHRGSIPKTQIVKVDTKPLSESPFFAYIKYGNKDLETFDKAFHVMLNLQEQEWFLDFRGTEADVYEKIELIPEKNKWVVKLKDKEAIVRI
jgi:hypothetical protein